MTTISLRQDPFADVETLVRSVFGPTAERPAGWTPASEVFRDGDDAVIRVELPGVDPATDINVEIERAHLVIRGERRPDGGPERSSRIRELRYGSFRRVFRLPDHVTPEDLVASYDAGLLTVRVLGAHTPPRPVQIRIGVASAAAPVEGTAGEVAGTVDAAPAADA